MMYKLKAVVMSALIIMVIVLVPGRVYAKSGVVRLTENKVYRCDLNGDKKKENVKVTTNFTKISWGEYVTVNIFVNKKKVFSKKEYWGKNFDYGRFTAFCIADINKKDRYKEILVFVGFGRAYATVDAYAVQFRNKNKVKVYNGNCGLDNAGNTRSLFSQYNKLVLSRGFDSTKGSLCYRNMFKEIDGKVCVLSDTPYWCGSFGCYFVYVPVGLSSDGSLIAKDLPMYKLSSECTIAVSKHKYKLNRNTKLYRGPSRKSKYSIYKKGIITPLYIKPIPKPSNYFNAQNQGDAFIKVKTASGKSGWIYFKNEIQGTMVGVTPNSILEYTPGWS